MGGAVFQCFLYCSREFGDPCKVPCPLTVLNQELVSSNNSSCIIPGQQALVSRSIWLQVSILNIVWDPFGAVPDAVLYIGDQTHSPLGLEGCGLCPWVL